MPRGPRNIAPEGFFHLIARGNNGIALCQQPRDFEALKRRMTSYFQKIGMETHHYSLMGTHVHAVVWVPRTEELARTMQALQVSYFYYFKRTYGYSGHLWHSRFRAIPLQSESHMLQCGRYVELNSVYAGIVGAPDAYPWSSHHFYAKGMPDPLASANPLLLDKNGDLALSQDAYREWVLEGRDLNYKRLKKEFERGG